MDEIIENRDAEPSEPTDDQVAESWYPEGLIEEVNVAADDPPTASQFTPAQYDDALTASPPGGFVEVGAQVLSFPNAIPDAVCDGLVAGHRLAEATGEATAGETYDGPHPAKKSSDWRLPSDHPLDIPLYGAMRGAFLRYIEQYEELAALPVRDTGYNIQRYPRLEGRYSWHVDSLGLPTSERALAGIAYLNDVREGGGTQFYHQSITVLPARGTIILFPPFWTHRHRGLVPISNDKYIATTFFCWT